MNNVLYNVFRRVLPSSWFARSKWNQHVALIRQRSYWQSNSIYLDNIINKISTDIAMQRFKHVKITRDPGGVDKMDWYESSDLAQALSVSPNDYETPIVFWASVVRTILQDGVAVVVPRVENGILQELQLVTDEIKVQDGKLIVKIDDKEIEMDVMSVWIFQNPKASVTSQLNAISDLIDENLQALSLKLSEPKKSLRGLIKLHTSAEDDELQKRAEKRVASILSSAETSGVGYLQKGEDWIDLKNEYSTASQEDLEFLKSQLYQAYGINEKLFTCDYDEMQFRAYYSTVMKVYQRVIAEEINRKWFSKTARTQGHKVLVYYDLTDLVSFKDLSDIMFKNKYSAVLNSNELREMFYGLPGYVGGDSFESNKNAVPVGKVE